ncbi:MAG: hypothetical protein LBU65_14490 [Planctomycetaceae bacterium]|jgi:hypothetical protein|nr:hypothetical protein [Planctomycetaceae bacterium]
MSSEISGSGVFKPASRSIIFQGNGNQRAVTVEHFAEHRVGRFGKRIKNDAQGFCAAHFAVGAVIADDKMMPAVFAFVALFAVCETALVKMLRMTVLAIH